MAKFTYTAENNEGEIYRGISEARDRFELYKIIRSEGGKVISVSEDRSDNIFSFEYWSSRIATIPEHQKITFSRNLGAMLTAGLSLARALSVLERQTKNARLKRVISQLESDIRKGDALHESMKRFSRVFSSIFVAMVKSGEEAGDLSGSLKGVAEQMNQSYNLKKKIRGALIYPSIIVVAIIGIGTLMLTEVVPTLAQTFEEVGAELPASTQAVIGLSNFLVQHTISAIAIVFGFIFVSIIFFRTKFGRRTRDFVFIHIPLIGTIVREVNSARTARTLASLLSSGVDVITSINITTEVVQNSYFREILNDAAKSVQMGEPFAKPFALREDLYPPLVGEMIAVGEETGALTDMFTQLAEFYEDEVSRKTKDMSTVIEPFLMIIIGAAVGFFAISMISPIYSLSENI
jgi:type IV pilus assembly protein PilC